MAIRRAGHYGSLIHSHRLQCQPLIETTHSRDQLLSVIDHFDRYPDAHMFLVGQQQDGGETSGRNDYEARPSHSPIIEVPESEGEVSEPPSKRARLLPLE